MTREKLILLGNIVWAGISANFDEYTTRQMAAKFNDIASDTQSVYKALRQLAESGFPAARQGPEKEMRRFGKTLKQRPWIWARPAGASGVMAKWRDSLMKNPRAAGPYAAIEARLSELEKKMEALGVGLTAHQKALEALETLLK